MEIIDNFGIVESSIMVVAGLLVLLFGYRIKKVAFFVAWFLLGYLGTTFLLPILMPVLPEAIDSEMYQKMIPIGGGLLLALLGFSIEKICVSGICFILTILVSTQYFGTDMQVLVISAIVGTIAAGLAATMIKPATILVTAGVGSYVVLLSFFKLVPSADPEILYWPMLVGLIVIGAIFQFVTAKKSR